ncbi:hypothetical protein [Phytopseudomonas flavescens]|nr:hypothetical protein [Pseudomonas flavescens]
MRYLLPIILAVLLSACGSDEQGGDTPRKGSEPAVADREPARPQAPVQPIEQPAKAKVEDVAPVTRPAAAEKKAETVAPKKVAERARVEKKPQKVVKAAPRTKLDLSLPVELTAKLDAENRGAENGVPPILPAFFEEKKPSLDPFQLSGKLLTGEAGSEYSNSLEGAELHFEFRR